MESMEKVKKLKLQIRKQKKFIKKLENMVRFFAPYMEFTDD